MTCQHCNAHATTFHYTGNINGQIIEQHLCANCAAILQNTAFAERTANLGAFSELFSDSFFGNRRNAMRTERSAFAPIAPPVVPEPGEAKIPLIADADLKARRALNQLRAELESAVEAENFERAAELRDEIYRLEQAS